MKILLEGDISEENLKKIGKLLNSLYRGKKEHINFLILEGLENRSLKDTIMLFDEMISEKDL